MQATPTTGANLRRLTKRAQFLRVGKGSRAGRAGFSLQANASADAMPGVGFTVTKKTGNSAERNRIKRRLRAVVRACAANFLSQHDYVLVGRRDALCLPFDQLVGDLDKLLVRVNTGQSSGNKAQSNKADGLRKTRP